MTIGHEGSIKESTHIGTFIVKTFHMKPDITTSDQLKLGGSGFPKAQLTPKDPRPNGYLKFKFLLYCK